MLMRMLLCTVITMVDTILIATLLTDIPMLTLATGIPSTITTARGLLMLSPTVDTTDMVATTDTPDLTTDTDTIAVRQQTQQRQRNFTDQVHCLLFMLPGKSSTANFYILLNVLTSVTGRNVQCPGNCAIQFSGVGNFESN